MTPMPDTLEHTEQGPHDVLVETLTTTIPLELFQKLQVLQEALEAENLDIAVIALLEAYTDQAIDIARAANDDGAVVAVPTTEQLIQDNNRMLKALTDGIL